jgi:thymidylate synthase
MIKADKYFIENLLSIKNDGTFDRNPRPKYKDGTPAHSKFITSVFEKYDLSTGEFPITTLRNTAIKTGIKEILWIYQKQTSSLEVARELGVNWWEEWNIGDDTIGQRYGSTVKRYKLIDNLLDGLNKDPFSRRHIIDLYQYHDLNESNGLFPCAFQTMWSVRSLDSEMYLDLTLTSRSNDYIMAGFINKIQYVALQMMVAGHLGYKIGTFSHLTQNIHVYDRHFDAVDEILNRTPLNIQPQILLNENKNFYDYKIDDFEIVNIDGIKKMSSNLEIAI